VDEQKFLSLVATALEISDGSAISMDNTRGDLAEWDSLGNLAILSALDEATNGKVFVTKGVASAQSLRELYALING
jgi:acyl carrier protein